MVRSDVCNSWCYCWGSQHQHQDSQKWGHTVNWRALGPAKTNVGLRENTQGENLNCIFLRLARVGWGVLEMKQACCVTTDTLSLVNSSKLHLLFLIHNLPTKSWTWINWAKFRFATWHDKVTRTPCVVQKAMHCNDRCCCQCFWNWTHLVHFSLCQLPSENSFPLKVRWERKEAGQLFLKVRWQRKEAGKLFGKRRTLVKIARRQCTCSRGDSRDSSALAAAVRRQRSLGQFLRTLSQL